MKKLALIYMIILTLSLLAQSCQQRLSMQEDKVLFLGHRGSGANVYSQKAAGLPPENTLDAVRAGSKYLDGAEIDIQMSADSTLWLWHDDLFAYTVDSIPLSIPAMSDAEISQIIASSQMQQKITPLRDVLVFLNQLPDKKYLSLDVKGYFPYCPHLNEKKYLTTLAKQLTKLLQTTKLTHQVMVETDYQVFLDQMKQQLPEVDCYLLGYSNLISKINKAKEKGYEGISFNANDTSLNTRNINILKSKGLKIQLWTVNDTAKIRSILQFHPTTIQTDNLSVKQLFAHEDSI
jgi:glycerophosphoryl diester phosphodiesterase